MVHNPKHKVHSFRGLLGDGGQDEINLERQNVNLAYRITKFQIITELPGVTQVEFIVKVYKEEPTAVDGAINFSDPNLLAAAEYSANDNGWTAGSHAVVFDNELFSRNIYVTGIDVNGSYSVNYYIEIEEVPVNAATLMQLKLAVARKLDLSESAPDA